MNRSCTRVLMVIMGFHPITGGAERQAKKLAEELVRRGNSVDVLTMMVKGMSREETLNGIRIIRKGHFRHKLLQYTTIFEMYRFILKNYTDYDVVHVHQGLLASVASVCAAKKVGLPCLVKIGNSGYKFDLKLLKCNFWLGPLFLRWLLASDSLFVAITPQIRNELLDYAVDERRIEHIPNGVSLPVNLTRSTKRASLGLALNEIVGVCVARLTEAKNHKFILHVIKNANLSNTKILFLGEGPLREEIESTINEAGLNGIVQVVGNVDNVEDYLQAADFFILSSKTEGMSNALLESMAHGLPALVTDIPGNRCVLGNNCEAGFVCSLSEVESWREGLLALITNDQLRMRMGKQAKELIEKKFCIARIADCYETLYARLLKRDMCIHNLPIHNTAGNII